MSIETTMTALADVIRRKTGKTGTMTIAEMTQTLAECKTLGFAEVTGTISLSEGTRTITISDLPFSEILAVYIHAGNHGKGDSIISYFYNATSGESITHFYSVSYDCPVCYNSAAPTFENGVLTIKPGTTSNKVIEPTTYGAVANPSFYKVHSYYVCGAKE